MGLNWAFVAWGTANFAVGLAVGSHYWGRYHQKRNLRIAQKCRAVASTCPMFGDDTSTAIFLRDTATELEQS